MTDNVHKVPVKQWRRWGDESRAVFNELLSDFAAGFADTYLPPSMHNTVTPKQAYGLAWNAAWQAACVTEKVLSKIATDNMRPL